ncbi:hypothetical protein AL538_14130 [Vibrio harveyi]|uniref:Uncharacterized protein n=1 Tax=Vibrio harveyi TaxID=669 RepID=A0ABN4L389_VIBHA|nr:DUF5991 domain-containing protein [Vibrio harveyi]AMF98770.1 hypothetical protein AL538_14130 [Vibrio harveyi]
MDVTVSIFMLSAIASTSLVNSWDGRYRCELDLGANAAGQSAWGEYRLDVSKDFCFFEAKGFQLNESILCSVHHREQGLEVRFKSYTNGEVSNTYGVQVYQVNEILFLLEKRQEGLMTQWHSSGLTAPMGRFQSCFERQQ